jgi:hypothetical protein
VDASSPKEKAQKVLWGKRGRSEFFCLFSKKGFIEGMIKRAKREGVSLFKQEDPVYP